MPQKLIRTMSHGSGHALDTLKHGLGPLFYCFITLFCAEGSLNPIGAPWRPPGPPGRPLTPGMSSWVIVSHSGSLWVIFDPSGVNYSSAYIALFVAKILPNRPVHSKGLRTRVYARTRVRFLWNFVFPVLFGHNLDPLDQKKTPKTMRLQTWKKYLYSCYWPCISTYIFYEQCIFCVFFNF